MPSTTVSGTPAVDVERLLSGDGALMYLSVRNSRRDTTADALMALTAPIRAFASPLKPPRGGLVDYALTDAGMLVIFDAEFLTARHAIELAALVSGLDLVDINAEESK
ncbi:hypothetical protein [Streptacidiphilus albus]|nr:hypothetical protein [Streptacidiphilus albus]